MPPALSVVIVAYNRKKYLLNAIWSVLNQTISSSLVEVIVIKNFEDRNIDQFCTENNVKEILMDGTIGEYLARGVRESHGEIISYCLISHSLQSIQPLNVSNLPWHGKKCLCSWHQTTHLHNYSLGRNIIEN